MLSPLRMDQPLVSIFNFCRNRKQTIRRCMDSILAQTYENLEIIVQDGASTDGTLEILQSYNDPRIKLISAPDPGPAHAFWIALRRCTGHLIGSCLSDEIMMPYAIEDAVGFFKEKPELGAICRDIMITDIDDNDSFLNQGCEFKPYDYISGVFTPHFASCVFRREALEDVGLQTREWHLDCGEYELWARLGLRHPIAYKPGVGARYAVHPGQLSQNTDNVKNMFYARARIIKELFEQELHLNDNAVLRMSFTIANGLGFATYLRDTCKKPEDAEEIMAVCNRLSQKLERLKGALPVLE